MRMVCEPYCLNIELDECSPCVIVFEKAAFITEFVQMLCNQINGIEDKIVLAENNQELNIAKNVMFMLEPFSVDFNQRSIRNKLYACMTDIAADMVEENAIVNTQLQCMIERILECIPYDNIEYNHDFSWQNMLGLYDVHIAVNQESLLAKLCELIKICAMLCQYRCVVFANLKLYLEEDELKELYKIAQYCKLPLVLIEASERRKIEGEKLYIIDEDRCLIVK